MHSIFKIIIVLYVFVTCLSFAWASLVGQMVKNLLTMQETWVRSLILVWEIPWTEEPDGLQGMGSQRVRHDLATKQWQLQQYICGNAAAAATKSLQSCPTLCDPIDGSPPGSSVPGILQARTLEWVAISFSNA